MTITNTKVIIHLTHISHIKGGQISDRTIHTLLQKLKTIIIVKNYQSTSVR